jgi:hypothetical protein
MPEKINLKKERFILASEISVSPLSLGSFALAM